MSATKRKFNALLQGLSDSRMGLEDGSSAYNDLLQKRRRLGFPPSTAPKFDPPSSSIAPSSTASSLRRSQTDRQKYARKPAIRYCPTDRDELLRRLETFQDITRWTPKPDKLSEVEWAKRGWLCQAKETVRCVLCSKELVIKLSPNKPTEAEAADDDGTAASSAEALVDKYVELITTSHQEDCLWRKRGCDDSLLRLPLANAAAAQAALRQRYDELFARKDHLPYDFNLRIPVELEISIVLGLLPHDFFSPADAKPGSTTANPNRVALALALCGWQGLPDARIGSVLNSISCRTCLRRLGLWMFKSKEVDSSGNVVVPAPMEHLDIVREHRFFCPWRNGASQSVLNLAADSGNFAPGWEILIQTLRNEAHLRSTYTNSGSSLQPKDGALPSRSNAESGEADDVDDDEAQKAKDKERWSRLKKIKSLFDIKGGKGRSKTRPGTSHSTQSVSDKQG